MKARLLAAIVLATLVVACGGDTTPIAETPSPSAPDRETLVRAYVACFESRGVDARITEGGGIHFDSGGTLSSEQSQELIAACDAELDDMGLIVEPEIDEEWLRGRYADLVSLRDCVADLGYPTPDMVSLEVFLEDHAAQPHPYKLVFADAEMSSNDIASLVEACPDPEGVAFED